MELLAGWLLLSVLVAVLAARRGRFAIGYFLLALVLSPLVGLVVLLIVGPKIPPVTEQLARLEAARAGGLVGDEEYRVQAAQIARGGSARQP